MMDCKVLLGGSSSFKLDAASHASSVTSLISCIEKGSVLYIALSKSPIAVMKSIPAAAIGKTEFTFIAPAFTKGNGFDVLEMQSQGDLTELSLLLTKAVTQTHPVLVIFDGLSSLTFFYPMETLMRFVKFTLEKLQLTSTPSVFLVQDDAFLEKTAIFYDNNLKA